MTGQAARGAALSGLSLKGHDALIRFNGAGSSRLNIGSAALRAAWPVIDRPYGGRLVVPGRIVLMGGNSLRLSNSGVRRVHSNRFNMEYFFTCPYCWQQIPMVLDLSVDYQT
jgi:hypothetical protein